MGKKASQPAPSRPTSSDTRGVNPPPPPGTVKPPPPPAPPKPNRPDSN